MMKSISKRTGLFAALILFSLCKPATGGEPGRDLEPALVNPGPVGGPPSDAIILFDGHDLSKWKSPEGGEAKWKIENGYMEVNGTGYLITKEDYGDAQLHVEWASPVEVQGEGQSRGNSGVYLQGRYEIQVLDSYQNKTYFNGQAGALYSICGAAGQRLPETEVSGKPMILFSTRPNSLRTARSNRGRSPCCTTASWFRTIWP